MCFSFKAYLLFTLNIMKKSIILAVAFISVASQLPAHAQSKVDIMNQMKKGSCEVIIKLGLLSKYSTKYKQMAQSWKQGFEKDYGPLNCSAFKDTVVRSFQSTLVNPTSTLEINSYYEREVHQPSIKLIDLSNKIDAMK
jgi:conjugal transfer/entry exclusion protein